MNRPQPLARTPDEAAAYWVARRRLGLMDAGDEAAFALWRAEPDNAAALADAEGVVEDIGAVAAMTEVRAMREAALAAAPARNPVRWRAGALAACLAAIALVGTWAASLPEDTDVLVPSPALRQRFVTGVGEQRTVRLADGSTIALNTGTVVDALYSPGRRDVRLLQGQALFQVAHDTDRPFVVTAGDRKVTALGTRFDVRLDGPMVRVVLVEGRVAVDPLRAQGLGRVAPILARQTLKAGEQLTAEPGEGIEVAAADTDQATSWRRGQVIFRDDTIEAAVAEMNRYSDTQLIIDDPRIGALRISGVFGVTREENFLAALTSFYPIETVKRSPRVTALAWREEKSANR